MAVVMMSRIRIRQSTTARTFSRPRSDCGHRWRSQAVRGLLGFTAPLPFAIFVDGAIVGQGKFGLFGAVEGDNFAVAGHTAVARIGTGQTFQTGLGYAGEGLLFTFQVLLLLAAQQRLDGVAVTRHLGLQVGFDGSGRIVTR